MQLKSNKAWQKVSWAKFNNQDNFVEVSVHILGCKSPSTQTSICLIQEIVRLCQTSGNLIYCNSHIVYFFVKSLNTLVFLVDPILITILCE